MSKGPRVSAEVVLVDVDGVIADLSPWGELVTWPRLEWADFFAHVPDAVPLQPGIDLVNALTAAGFEVVYSTTRPAWCKAATVEWLHARDLPDGLVYYRPALDDARPIRAKAWHVKQMHWRRVSRRAVTRVGFVDDDRAAVDALRSVGTPAWLLADLAGYAGDDLAARLRAQKSSTRRNGAVVPQR